MHKQNFITITLIITGLALNPLMGETVEWRAGYSKVENQSSIVSSIAKILHNRGLEENAAERLASEVVNENESMLLAMMYGLETHDIMTREEVLAYLSQAALHQQKFDFKSYDQLIGMVEKTKKKPIDDSTRTKLGKLAKVHQTWHQIVG